MKILFVAAEVAPFSKTGGLGDVCGALPAALAARGHQVVTVSPCYGGARVAGRSWEERGGFWFWLFGAHHEVRFIVSEEGPGLAHVLLANPMYDRGGIYGDDSGVFGDNQLRYALMARASLEVARAAPLWQGAPLGEPDIVHAHDWQGALVPLYLNALYKPIGLFQSTRSVLTLHNAAHQGLFAPSTLGGLDLSGRHAATLQHDGALNTLKGGIVSADRVTAVSPTFAQELMTPSGGFGLDGVLRDKRDAGQLIGILNGIDDREWDPSSDPELLHPFDAADLSGKARSKEALQLELGLPRRADVPLFGIVSRLDWQKGVELLLAGSPSIFAQDLQFIVLGLGDPKLHEGLLALQRSWPDKIRVRLAKDFSLSHRVFAGSDFIVVPSLFEPCGLTQLYAMRYGAAPVVRAVGGLRDSVQPWDPSSQAGTGWTFDDFTPGALAETIGWAAHTWHTYPEAFARIQQNGMAIDWSWASAAKTFEDLYDGINPSR